MVDPGGVLIRFSHVKKAFGPKVIYSDLSFDVRRGEVITIMGPSGVGKSVLLKMLIGLLSTDAGSIEFDGQEVTKMNDHELTIVRRRIAYLFQGSALFDSLSVGENVAYGLNEQFWNTMSKKDIAARVEQSLEAVGLPGVEGMRPSDLSGGMRKRVALARTLALQPEVILYDEPTTGLDPITTDNVDQMILEAKQKFGVTSVVISHDIASALRVADRVAFLHEGTIVEDTSPAELRKSQHPFVKKFLSTWFDK